MCAVISGARRKKRERKKIVTQEETWIIIIKDDIFLSLLVSSFLFFLTSILSHFYSCVSSNNEELSVRTKLTIQGANHATWNGCVLKMENEMSEFQVRRGKGMSVGVKTEQEEGDEKGWRWKTGKEMSWKKKEKRERDGEKGDKTNLRIGCESSFISSNSIDEFVGFWFPWRGFLVCRIEFIVQ